IQRRGRLVQQQHLGFDGDGARVSDYTAFMYMGDLIEFGDTNTIFTNPSEKMTEDYITGRYG
ncbi:MAG: hypothetical protein K8I04_11755, partial [Gammaproteobacteria bacterium]|nr:hypothetical protein [Gammaproteobacteria bacterium]